MNIVFLETTQNYSYKFSAANTKVELLAKGLSQEGHACFILNGLRGYNGIRKKEKKLVDKVGEVITFPKRRMPMIGPVFNFPALVQELKCLSKGDDKPILVLASPYVHIYFIYVFLGRMFGYKIVTISHEWLPTIKRRLWIQNVLSSVYAMTFGRGIHAILPISHYIWDKCEHFGKPMLMTPILGEYPNEVIKERKEKSFVYCVYALYYRVIIMIVDSYKEYCNVSKDPYGLTLVLNGTLDQVNRVRAYIDEAALSCRIEIKTKLPYLELIRTYRAASALLIPLDPDYEQDHARFSQKIAEYLSSGSPVISNAVGEIPYYFENGKDMIITSYSVKGFSESFKWVQENPEKSTEIGLRGFETGKAVFNYQTFGKKLSSFLKTL